MDGESQAHNPNRVNSEAKATDVAIAHISLLDNPNLSSNSISLDELRCHPTLGTILSEQPGEVNEKKLRSRLEID